MIDVYMYDPYLFTCSMKGFLMICKVVFSSVSSHGHTYFNSLIYRFLSISPGPKRVDTDHQAVQRCLWNCMGGTGYTDRQTDRIVIWTDRRRIHQVKENDLSERTIFVLGKVEKFFLNNLLYHFFKADC